LISIEGEKNSGKIKNERRPQGSKLYKSQKKSKELTPRKSPTPQNLRDLSLEEVVR
jgi:hypothetical protein